MSMMNVSVQLAKCEQVCDRIVIAAAGDALETGQIEVRFAAGWLVTSAVRTRG
jgi:ABC-type dipeptide/oligopeptide/nickel transport system ATPase component